jgi:hypothetical protein
VQKMEKRDSKIEREETRRVHREQLFGKVTQIYLLSCPLTHAHTHSCLHAKTCKYTHSHRHTRIHAHHTTISTRNLRRSAPMTARRRRKARSTRCMICSRFSIPWFALAANVLVEYSHRVFFLLSLCGKSCS